MEPLIWEYSKIKVTKNEPWYWTGPDKYRSWDDIQNKIDSRIAMEMLVVFDTSEARWKVYDRQTKQVVSVIYPNAALREKLGLEIQDEIARETAKMLEEEWAELERERR